MPKTTRAEPIPRSVRFTPDELRLVDALASDLSITGTRLSFSDVIRHAISELARARGVVTPDDTRAKEKAK